MIAAHLKSGKGRVAIDCSIFNKWEEKQITTRSAIKEFKQNNDIEEEISEDEFVKWLHSLGYRRKEDDDEQ